MGIARVCKCEHHSGYHKQIQINDKQGKYESRIFVECLWWNCDCKKFDEVKVIPSSHYNYPNGKQDVTN